jgi:glycosyltransferase involved in cell wall biosynthesis
MKLCVLVPALNCAHALPELRARVVLPGPEDEIIIVDDASADQTYEVASRLPRVHVVRNDSRRGYGGTSRRLYEVALERGADITVNIHGDLGHRPEDIPLLLEHLQGGYDVVLGSRLLHVLERARLRGWHLLFSPDVASGFPPSRVIGHIALTWIQNKCYGTELHSFHEGMRACNRRAIEWSLGADLATWYSYDLEFLLKASRSGLKIGEVPVAPNYDDRARSSAPRVRYGLNVLRHAAADRVRRIRRQHRSS